MKYKEITISLKRDIRLARYNVSQCQAELTVQLEEGDTLGDIYKEVHEDVMIIVDEMIATEVMINALKNKPKK